MAGIEVLTSRSSRVKAARKLARRASRTSERKFLAEGPQAIREALRIPGCVVEVFATIDVAERYGDLEQQASAVRAPWHLVDDAALASLTDTVSPQGLVAVCRFLDRTLDEIATPGPELVAICAHVRDPGNAGTVIRCADATGADAVVLAGTSVDAYNGKAVRASVGSIFHLPVVTDVSIEDAVAAARAAGLRVLAADGAATVTLDDLADTDQLSQPTAWLFGNEAWGLAPEVSALADQIVAVPIYGKAESLNLATAAAVCLYTSARAQRRASREAVQR